MKRFISLLFPLLSLAFLIGVQAGASAESLENTVCVLMSQGRACDSVGATRDWGTMYNGPEIWMIISYRFHIPYWKESTFSKVIDSPVCKNNLGWTIRCIAAATRAALR